MTTGRAPWPRDVADPAGIGGDDRQTDAGLAERFARSRGLDLRFNHRRNLWLNYLDHRWQPDRNGGTCRLMIGFARKLQEEALEIPDRKLREEALKVGLKVESKAGLDRMEAIAKNLLPIADAGDGWDADPWLLGAPNGVIDLRSGELRAGDPADRITMTIGAAYDATATCPRWEQFLEEIFVGRTELIEWVQRFVGYSLTGRVIEQILAVAYGVGANGKSTFLEVLGAMCGDYAWNMPFSTIELRQRASIPNDLAALQGRRFVTASETNDGVRLNESRIKTLTGSDTVTARRLYREHFQFQPTAKFWLAVNHKPTVRDDSHGFWRRLRLIPFTRTFDGVACDEELKDTLLTETPGVLNWAITGCLAWQQQGLDPAPEIVLAATREYQGDSDPLRDFLEECCEVDTAATVPASVLYGTYVRWCDRQKLSRDDRMSRQQFGGRIGNRFERRHVMAGKVYQGLKVVMDKLI